MDAILSAIAENEKESAKYRQQEETNVEENIKAEWWLVGAAIAQTIALIGTLFAIRYQGVKTRDAAKAAETSAQAAKDNVELIIKKERARVQIELQPLDFGQEERTIKFTVSVHSPTAAYFVESEAAAAAIPSEHVNDAGFSESYLYPIYGLKSVIAPNAPQEPYTFLANGDNKRQDLVELRAGRFQVTVRGYIKYKDVFDRLHIIRFRRYWKHFGDDDFSVGEWVPCGATEENQEA